ncbi:MAG: hypothetical protein GC164_11395 [Phycisphaera sp.]|nr:hypothetical protein [Phycisphaera sp.]
MGVPCGEGCATIMVFVIAIGKLQLDAPFFQAGLAGYSDTAMRLVARKHGCPYCVTEAMLDQLLLNGGKGLEAAELDGRDHPIAGQLMGSHPIEMARAVKVLAGMGYDVIDVNLACPVKKIRKRSRGGHLLQAPDEAVAILDAVRQATPPEVPCTVKLRRGTDDSPEAERNFHRILQAVIELGYAGAVVHGRTVEQKYVGPSRWAFLRGMVERYGNEYVRHAHTGATPFGSNTPPSSEGGAGGGCSVSMTNLTSPPLTPPLRQGRGTELACSPAGATGGLSASEKNSPSTHWRASRQWHTENQSDNPEAPRFVLGGSGDVWCAADIFRMIHETGVSLVSVARGCIGNPWVFTQARAIMRGDAEAAIRPPTVHEQRSVLLEHFELSLGLHGEKRASMMMRKFGIKFSRHHPRKGEVAGAFIAVKSLADWHTVLERYYSENLPGVALDDAIPDEATPTSCEAA